MTEKGTNLLFLYDFGHLVVEGHLLVLAEFLLLTEEHHTALVVPAVHTLYESAALENGVVVPLDFEHPPVLLDVNRSLALLLPPLLCLTNSFWSFILVRT